jgi:hypothetical protein
MQALTVRLPEKSIRPSHITALSPPQRARFLFYRALIKITRLLAGSITVIIPARTPHPDPKPIAAVLWLPTPTALLDPSLALRLPVYRRLLLWPGSCLAPLHLRA